MKYINPEHLTDRVVESMRNNPHEGKLALNHRLEHEHFLRMIAFAPEEDVVEVVHGRWITRVEFNNGKRVIAVCSNCNVQGEVRTHRNEWGIWHIDSPYCPNCGAKMDLED